jgi:P4 family phage/plasmid primase-like protien
MSDLYYLSRGFTNYFDRAVYHVPTEDGDPPKCPRKFRTIYSRKNGHLLVPTTHLDRLEDHFINIVRGSAEEWECPPPVNLPRHSTPLRHYDAEEEAGDGRPTLGDVLIQSDRVDRAEWVKIGVSMLIVWDEAKAYREFLKYSERHPSHDINKFNKTFEDLARRNYKRGGWKVLKKWTPMEHLDLIEEVELPTNSSDYDIADWIFKTFTQYSIVTTKNNNRANGSKGVWFKFIDHRWQETCDVEIKNDMITRHLYNAYKTELGIANRRVADTEDEEAKKVMAKKSRELAKILEQVKSTRKMSTIGAALFNRYYQRDFLGKLNQDPHLLGFTNGVYDFRKRVFRPGREEDNISFSTGYDFKTERDLEQEDEIRKLLWQICCERQDLYDILIKVLARNLIGDNTTQNQLFYCLYGRGSNGKSTIASMLKEMLGDYYAIMPTTLLSQKSQRSDACNSDIARLVGKRIVVCSETEQDVPINISTLKNMSGEEFVSYRALFESIRETRITWSVFLLTNDKLRLPPNDFGTTRRFRYIPFNAKFLDPDKLEGVMDTPTVKHYPKRGEIMRNLRDMRQDFMNLLIHTQVEDRISFPNWIMEDTEAMIRSQDKLTGILDSLFEKAPSNEYGLCWTDMNRILKEDRQIFQIKFNSVSAMKEAICDRLPYAYLVNCPVPQWYISTEDQDGTEIKKRRRTFFRGIRLKRLIDEDEEDETSQVECSI